MSELLSKIEALLFSSGKKMTIEELSKLCRDSPDNIKMVLAELRKNYEEKNLSLMIIEEGNSWKISVREQFMPLVQNIVTETELSRAVTETLAVIAFKYPALQSEIVKIRSNKAYDHLKELEELGYITRARHGRTNKITLTQKFFQYFELPPEKLKEQLSQYEEVTKSIEEKEKKAKEAMQPPEKEKQTQLKQIEENTKQSETEPSQQQNSDILESKNQ